MEADYSQNQKETSDYSDETQNWFICIINHKIIPEKEMKDKNIRYVFTFALGIASTPLFNVMHRYLKGLSIDAGDWLNFSGSLLGVGVSVLLTLWDKVPFLNQNQKDNSKLDQIMKISEGLAVGYFYNFLKAITSLDTIKVQYEDKTQETFEPDKVQIQVLIPEVLKVANIKRVKESVSKYLQADVVINKGEKRNLKIKFQLATDKNTQETELIIKDSVNACHVMKEYMQDSFSIEEKANSDEWDFLGKEALQKFKETVERLATKDGLGLNRVRIKWEKVE